MVPLLDDLFRRIWEQFFKLIRPCKVECIEETDGGQGIAIRHCDSMTAKSGTVWYNGTHASQAQPNPFHHSAVDCFHDALPERMPATGTGLLSGSHLFTDIHQPANQNRDRNTYTHTHTNHPANTHLNSHTNHHTHPNLGSH
jgi:hypothetical protein